MHRNHQLLGPLCVALLLGLQPAAAQDPGDLDPTWGDGGMVVLPLVGYGVMDIAVQADHKLVVATLKDTIISPLVRLLPDGSLDPDFGENGMAFPVQIADPPYWRNPWTLALDDSGRILIAGTGTDSLWLARMLPDGAPDLSFGPQGYFAYGNTIMDSYVGTNITFDEQGRILLGAVENNWPDRHAALLRVLPTGVLDSTFGVSGRTDVPSPPGSKPLAYESCLTPSGSIFTVGSCTVDFDQRPFVGKMHPNGMPDLSFGTDGYILLQFSSFPNNTEFLTQCHMLAPDRLLLNTRGNGPAGESDVTALIDTLGNYVQSFGQNGRAWTDLESNSYPIGPQNSPMELGAPRGILDEPRIVNCNYYLDRMNVGRMFTNGQADAQFGSDGVATHTMAGPINVSSLALDGCRIYVGFQVVQSGAANQAVVIALDGCGNTATEVERTNAPTDLAPYPNPAQHSVRVQLARANEQVRLHDALGRCLPVPVHTANGSALLDLGALPNGVYTLSTDHGRTSRLVVQR